MKNFFLLVISLAVYVSAAKYTIQPNEFRLGEELRLNALMAIGTPGQKVLSTKPDFSKKAEIYMRRKIDGTNYAFYTGNLNPDPFRSFYAFDLEANKITLKEALQMKFYAKRRTKPYRDENEIYFSGRYLYSPRLPVLYFMRNDEWHRLESVVAPGVLHVISEEKGVLISTTEEINQPLPKRYFPIPTGLFYATFTADGYYPMVEAIDVKANKQNTLRVRMMPMQVSEISFYPDVHENQIVAADSLEKVERFYDLYRRESLNVADTLSSKWFDQVYPSIQVIGDTNSANYKAYAKSYQEIRKNALDLWTKARMAPAEKLRQMIFTKMSEFESKPVSIPVHYSDLKVYPIDTTVQKTPNVTQDSLVKDSVPVAEVLPPADSIALHFSTEDGRISVDWVGSVEGSLPALVKNIKDGNVKIQVILEKNKPVWLYAKDTVSARKHYRFVNVEFFIGEALVKGKGNFRLPDSLLAQAEVQAWLHPEKQSVTPKKEEVPKVDTVSVKEESPLKMDSLRREYLVLDSSSFRFRGKIVGISGFAIQTHEVTQGDFARMILAKKLDVKMKDRSKFKGENKPVQNITWLDAQAYCKALGGNLPTESQWEYAARAGGNDGFVWEALEKGKPVDYAIYSKNSGDLSSKDSAYGPQNVGSKQPNAWGIYDMAGNVAEWTLDNYSSLNFTPDDVDPTGSWMGYTKIIKGGSFDDGVKKLNASARDDEDPRYWSERLGFRCVFPVK